MTLDPESRLSAEPDCLPASALITILGNLIENAFEAFAAAPPHAGNEVDISIREDAAGLLLGHSRPVHFALDLLAFAAAAVLACGFAAGLAAGGVVRWYMAAAMAAGALGWQAAVSGPLHRAAGLTLRLLTLPMRLTERYLARPLAARLAVLRQKNKRSAAKRKKHPKKNKKI